MKPNHPHITQWSVSLVRNVSPPFWPWPKIQTTRTYVRIGWRWTSWSIHFERDELVKDQVDAILQGGVG